MDWDMYIHPLIHLTPIPCIFWCWKRNISKQTQQLHFALWEQSLQCISSAQSAICSGPLSLFCAAQRKDCTGRKWAFSSVWHCDSYLQFPKFMTHFEQASYWPVIIVRNQQKQQIMIGDLPETGGLDTIIIQNLAGTSLQWRMHLQTWL